MQRPRRTSEFHDEAGAIIRRQSRPQTRPTIAPSPSGGGGTAVKFANRQSRIAVRARSSSLDKGGAATSNAYLSVPTSTQRGVTPQKTPLSNKTTVNRVLFTAEKHRSGGGGGTNTGNAPLHNDKKWVQEHSQRITEYLSNFQTIGGFSTDFLNKGLRQMSIKQFVAIVNFFLSFIWGKRFVVGNNHVEDIIQILHRLHYPHAVNKSWLKTPNTQHSFGNVIVLFDYLMDFVPPHTGLDDGPAVIVDYFELLEPQGDNASSYVGEDIFQIPDLEFQCELLKNSEEGFMLWDTQMHDEFNNLQKTTCDLLIQRTCNFPNTQAVEAEIDKLKVTLRSLEEQTPVEDTKMIKSKSEKNKKLRELRSEMSHNHEKYREYERDLKRLKKKSTELTVEVEELEKQIKELRDTISQQICTVEQRDKLITEKKQMEQMLKIEGNTVRNLEDRNYQKQVLYSRVLHRFTEHVGQFNELMREVAFSEIDECRKMSLEDLQLPLRPDNEQLLKLIPLLHKIKELIVKTINENRNKLSTIHSITMQIINEVDTQLETQLNALRALNTTAKSQLEKLREHAIEETADLHDKQLKVQEQLATAGKCIEQLQQLKAKKRMEIDLMKEQNEQTMKEAEEKHEKLLAQRRAFLEQFSQILEAAMEGETLQQLRNKVKNQEKQLEDLKKGLGE